MSRGKKQDESFAHNPFRDLKGLSVSKTGQAPEPVPEKMEKPRQQPAADRPGPDDAALFAEEMTLLGVQREGGRRRQGEPAGGRPTPTVEEPSDRELFLAALEETPLPSGDQPPAEPRQAAARPLKRLARGDLAPQAEVDLHGLSREQAVARVRYFLENARFHGLETVLIVTGRGLGSEGEPVLRGAVEAFLAGEGRRWVREWGRAPRHYGGEGALVAFLREGEKR